MVNFLPLALSRLAAGLMCLTLNLFIAPHIFHNVSLSIDERVPIFFGLNSTFPRFTYFSSPPSKTLYGIDIFVVNASCADVQIGGFSVMYNAQGLTVEAVSTTEFQNCTANIVYNSIPTVLGFNGNITRQQSIRINAKSNETCSFTAAETADCSLAPVFRDLRVVSGMPIPDWLSKAFLPLINSRVRSHVCSFVNATRDDMLKGSEIDREEPFPVLEPGALPLDESRFMIAIKNILRHIRTTTGVGFDAEFSEKTGFITSIFTGLQPAAYASMEPNITTLRRFFTKILFINNTEFLNAFGGIQVYVPANSTLRLALAVRALTCWENERWVKRRDARHGQELPDANLTSEFEGIACFAGGGMRLINARTSGPQLQGMGYILNKVALPFLLRKINSYIYRNIEKIDFRQINKENKSSNYSHNFSGYDTRKWLLTNVPSYNNDLRQIQPSSGYSRPLLVIIPEDKGHRDLPWWMAVLVPPLFICIGTSVVIYLFCRRAYSSAHRKGSQAAIGAADSDHVRLLDAPDGRLAHTKLRGGHHLCSNIYTVIEDSFLVFLPLLSAFLFLVSNTTVGATVLLGDELSVYSFSLWRTVTDMWQSGLKPLATLIFLFSGVYPYIKVFALLLFAFTRARSETSDDQIKNDNKTGSSKDWAYLVVRAIDTVGKFSLVDVFVMGVLKQGLEIEGIAAVHAERSFYCFATATGLLMLAGSYAVHVYGHLNRVNKKEFEYGTHKVTRKGITTGGITNTLTMHTLIDDSVKNVRTDQGNLLDDVVRRIGSRLARKYRSFTPAEQNCASVPAFNSKVEQTTASDSGLYSTPISTVNTNWDNAANSKAKMYYRKFARHFFFLVAAVLLLAIPLFTPLIDYRVSGLASSLTKKSRLLTLWNVLWFCDNIFVNFLCLLTVVIVPFLYLTSWPHASPLASWCAIDVMVIACIATLLQFHHFIEFIVGEDLLFAYSASCTLLKPYWFMITASILILVLSLVRLKRIECKLSL